MNLFGAQNLATRFESVNKNINKISFKCFATIIYVNICKIRKFTKQKNRKAYRDSDMFGWIYKRKRVIIVFSSRLIHKNIVSIICESQHKIMISQYLTVGWLRRHLHRQFDEETHKPIFSHCPLFLLMAFFVFSNGAKKSDTCIWLCRNFGFFNETLCCEHWHRKLFSIFLQFRENGFSSIFFLRSDDIE